MAGTISSYALTDLQKVKDYLGKSELTGVKESLLIFLLNSVSMWARQYTGLPLKQTAFEFTGLASGAPRLDGTGLATLQLPVYPIIRITHINTDHGSHGDDSTDELDFDWSGNVDNGAWTYGKDNDYTYDLDTGVITVHGGHYFPDYPQNVVVKCQAGYSTDTTRASNWDGPHYLNTHPECGWDGAGQVLEMSVVQQVAEMFHRKTRQKDGIASYSTEGGTVTFLDRELLPDVKAVWSYHRKPLVLL